MSGLFKERSFKQPETFAFTPDNLNIAKAIMAKYPFGRQQSAVMPLLYLAQQQNNGWVPTAAMDCIAEMLQMPPIKVYEVANFYTMYNKQPVGKHLVQVCRTTPCWLRGAEDITAACKKHLGIDVGETTVDEQFSLVEVECLGACANAPMVQINDAYYEDLTPESIIQLLDDLQAGKSVKEGSQTGRLSSEPTAGEAPTTVSKAKKKLTKTQ